MVLKQAKNMDISWGCLTLIFGLPSLMFGASIIFFGTHLLFSLSSLNTLQCKRYEMNQIKCDLSSSTLLKKNSRSIQLLGAVVEKSSGVPADPEEPTFRVLLLTEAGKIPLSEMYTGGWNEDNHKIEEKVNSFLRSPQKNSLEVQQDSRLSQYFAGLISAIFGIFILSFGGLMIYIWILGKAYSVKK
jgi:hypothetical protein